MTIRPEVQKFAEMLETMLREYEKQSAETLVLTVGQLDWLVKRLQVACLGFIASVTEREKVTASRPANFKPVEIRGDPASETLRRDRR